MNSRMVTSSVPVLVLFAALAYASAQADGVTMPREEFPGLGALNAAQRETVDRFVLDHERPTGELKRLAVRGGIAVRSSVALQRLFPHSRFVVVPWIYQVDPAAKHLYSIPWGIYDVLAISDEGQQESIFHSSGNQAEFGLFLHDHRLKIRNKTTACDVARALADIYGGGLSLCNDVRHSSSEWRLSYKEMPFRPISSYERSGRPTTIASGSILAVPFSMERWLSTLWNAARLIMRQSPLAINIRCKLRITCGPSRKVRPAENAWLERR